jgi:hypothetical protein
LCGIAQQDKRKHWNVKNNTSCEVKYQIVVSNDSERCTNKQYSSIINLAANSSIVYDISSSLPKGLKSAKSFIGVVIYTTPDSCNGKKHYIGNPCLYKKRNKSYIQYNASCNICWTILAVWGATDKNGRAVLNYYP